MRLHPLRVRVLNFVQSSLSAHMLRRHSFLELLQTDKTEKKISLTFTSYMLKISQLEPDQAIQTLNSHKDGLSESEVREIRSRIGLNEVAHEKAMTWQTHLWLCFRNPFNILLSILAILSYVTDGDLQGTAIICAMVIISVAMRFIQERRSDKAAETLKAMVSNTATVLRQNDVSHLSNENQIKEGTHLSCLSQNRIELPIKELVLGDIVLLSAGDMIPADLRVLTAKDLFVSQGTLTGESLPVEKFVTQPDSDITNPLELENLCFMGTNVLNGTAVALVIGTGGQTYFGSLAERLSIHEFMIEHLTLFKLGSIKSVGY